MADTPSELPPELKPVETAKTEAAPTEAQPGAAAGAAMLAREQQEPASQPMAPQGEMTMQGEPQGVGMLGLGTAIVGGTAAGVGAQKLVVDSSLKSNLSTPYMEEMKKVADATNAADTLIGATAADIQRQAETSMNKLRHEAFNAVQNSTEKTPTMKAIYEGPADGLLHTSKIKTKPEDFTRIMEAGKTSREAAIKTAAEKVHNAAAGEARTAAAKDLMNVLVQESNKIDKALAADKVKKISWVKRLNPFSGELHLSGGQKTGAVITGAVTAAVGAFGIVKAAQWLGGGKGEDSAPQR